MNDETRQDEPMDWEKARDYLEMMMNDNRVARFWADEPTEEEKAAAKWEDEPDDEE